MGHYKHLCQYTTNELVKELSTREGIERLEVAPHKEFDITIEENWMGDIWWQTDHGSAIILIVKD